MHALGVPSNTAVQLLQSALNYTLQHHHVYSTLIWWCNVCTPERQATPNVGLSAEGMPPMLKDLACRHCSIGGMPSTPSAESPTFGVACLSDAESHIISSPVASHDSDVFDCLMEVSCVAATSGGCETMP